MAAYARRPTMGIAIRGCFGAFIVRQEDGDSESAGSAPVSMLLLLVQHYGRCVAYLRCCLVAKCYLVRRRSEGACCIAKFGQ